jgi:hypothetical protein
MDGQPADTMLRLKDQIMVTVVNGNDTEQSDNDSVPTIDVCCKTLFL